MRRRFTPDPQRLPPGKALDNFDFSAVAMLTKARVMAITAGDTWLEQGANLILFGPPGGGKSHLAAAIDKVNKYHLHILDDLACVTKDQAETSVLFLLIGARYEHRSILITANQPFGEWTTIFPDPAMILAAPRHRTIIQIVALQRQASDRRVSQARRAVGFIGRAAA